MKRTSAVPALNLEPLHRSLKHAFPRPIHGVGTMIALGILGALLLGVLTEPEPVPKTDRVLFVGGERADAGAPQPRSLTPHEQRLKELMEKMKSSSPADDASLPEDKSETPKKEPVNLGPVPEGHVRVAAVQFFPLFNQPALNRERLEPYIRRAAQEQASIVVLPEAAVQGYAEMNKEIAWKNGSPGESEVDDYVDVRPVVETADGESVRFFANLSRELKIYLTVPWLEKNGGNLYSSVILLDPKGESVLHYRKRQLVSDFDGKWATAGDLGAPVVETPLGRLGVMVSYDMPRSLPELAEKKADIVLWCAAFRGENFEKMLRTIVRAQAKKYGMNLVLANWTYKEAWWSGYGHSRVISREGQTLSQSGNQRKAQLVIADVPVVEAPIDTPAKAE